jgi:hypothetical protein
VFCSTACSTTARAFLCSFFVLRRSAAPPFRFFSLRSISSNQAELVICSTPKSRSHSSRQANQLLCTFDQKPGSRAFNHFNLCLIRDFFDWSSLLLASRGNVQLSLMLIVLISL